MRRALILLALPAIVQAQSDTTALEKVVITAERARSTLGTSTAAVTRIEGAELARVPHATVADMLRLVPGIAIVDFDGRGGDPQIMARGFYGGGEAEYVHVMVDGKPVEQLHNGLIPWEAMPPLSAIDAIEVVRGGSSALYGSSAIGAVINVITRRAATPRLSTSGGTFDTWRLDGSFGTLATALDHSEGFRDHSKRTSARARFSVRLADSIGLAASSYWRDFEDPGVLGAGQLVNRRQSHPMFQFDNTSEQSHTVTLDGKRGALSAWVSGNVRRNEAVRTIILAPDFGDTKERVADTRRVLGMLQFARRHFTAGVDASYGTLDSKYYQVENGERGDRDAAGDGSRAAAALFTQYAAELGDALRVSLGARGDWLEDSFDGNSASHVAFSPKLGANLRLSPYVHAYLTASRSFKAPTLDQLFDQRSIPVPFPPFSITTSNRQLEPQFGTNFEGGLYQAAGNLTMSLSIYQMDMKDELDFDVQTLRYVNIGRSRHRGVEAAARYEARPGVTFFMNRTWQWAKARSGDNSGKYLKAIPRNILSGGFAVRPGARLEIAGAIVQHSGMFLDDANTRRINPYSRLDGQAIYRVLRDVSLTLEVRNAFRSEYETTGFPDPAGGSDSFFYPAAPRSYRLGMRYGW